MSAVYFHSFDRVEPLNIDLEWLAGGGDAPCEFEGLTADGRIVFCHYRNGVLTIDIGNEPGASPYANGTELLSATIGPPFTSDISKAELCHCAGFTIKQSMPDLQNSELDDVGHTYDGKTVFFQAFGKMSLQILHDFLKVLSGSSEKIWILKWYGDLAEGQAGFKLWKPGDKLDGLINYIYLGRRPFSGGMLLIPNETIGYPSQLTGSFVQIHCPTLKTSDPDVQELVELSTRFRKHEIDLREELKQLSTLFEKYEHQ